MAKPNEVELGQEVKCIITGFQGIAVSRAEFLYGCARIGIQPPMNKDGKVPDDLTIDEVQLKVMNTKRVIKAKMPKPRFKLGERARDPITELEGTIIGRATHINGCAKVALQRKSSDMKDREFDKGFWIDEPQLEKVVEPPAVKPGKRGTGGPKDNDYKHQTLSLR